MKASSNRVESKCIFFKSDGCGGCDWQHTNAQHQRDLKLEVLIIYYYLLYIVKLNLEELEELEEL